MILPESKCYFGGANKSRGFSAIKITEVLVENFRKHLLILACGRN